MSRNHNLDTDQHRSNRSVLRIIGPLILVLGIILTVIGLGGFFATLIKGFTAGPGSMMEDGFGDGVKLFFLAFLGLPMMAIGGAITKFAYMGSIARYAASEIAPVGKDTFNYMADGTKGAIGDLAQSVGAGIAAGMSGEKAVGDTVDCPGCGEACDAGARFCDQCGTAIPGEVRCTDCGQMNDPDARFCDQCGKSTGV